MFQDGNIPHLPEVIASSELKGLFGIDPKVSVDVPFSKSGKALFFANLSAVDAGRVVSGQAVSPTQTNLSWYYFGSILK